MSKRNEHTPGPWRATKAGGSVLADKAVTSSQVVAFIAVPEVGDRKANALIIAAAPTMYEELRSIIEGIFEELRKEGEEMNLDDPRLWILRRAQSAIAAIEGGDA